MNSGKDMFKICKANVKKKSPRRKSSLSIKDLEKPYLRLVSCNSASALRKY